MNEDLPWFQEHKALLPETEHKVVVEVFTKMRGPSYRAIGLCHSFDGAKLWIKRIYAAGDEWRWVETEDNTTGTFKLGGRTLHVSITYLDIIK